MSRTMLCGLALLLVVMASGIALAQDEEYALEDYMPRTVGSTWTMQDADGDTSTMKVLEPQDINGTQVSCLATVSDDGTPRRGTFETVDAEKYIIYGRLFGGRGGPGGGGGGEPRPMLYETPIEFAATMTVGETQEATITMTRGGQQVTTTTKLTLEAVEAVTVPAGTFEDCLKLVTTTQRGDREMKSMAWYAKGVGTVKTERTGRDGQAMISELTEYSLAE